MGDKRLLSYETLVHALAGSAGSVTAMTVFYPLDTVRSRLQLEENRLSKSTIQTIIDLIDEEGFGTLYRGLKPTLQSLCVSNFVYFYTFHALKRLRSAQDSSAVRDLLIGSVAGVVNVLTTTPLWVVNTRVKMQGIRNDNVPSHMHFKGLFDGLYKIYKSTGLLSLWSGTLPSLMLVINPAIQFMTYESIKRRLNPTNRQMGSLTYFLIAALAKTIATVLTYPLQIIQTRMRHGQGGRLGHGTAGPGPGPSSVSASSSVSNASVGLGLGQPGKKPTAAPVRNRIRDENSFMGILMKILRTQGPKGLFKGMESKIIQTVLTSALMFVIYEKIHRWVTSVLLMGRGGEGGAAIAKK